MKKKIADCSPSEVAVKSFFLGPQSENSEWLMKVVLQTLVRWFDWRRRLTIENGPVISDRDRGMGEYLRVQQKTEAAVDEILERFELEIPKFSPKYIGHMVSEISMPALIGHILTLLHNPNNISTEASAVGVKLEREAIEKLSKLVGLGPRFGHFTSGGTVANFEFLARARERWALWQAGAWSSGEADPLSGCRWGWENFSRVNRDSEKFRRFFCLDNPMAFTRQVGAEMGIPVNPPVLLVPANKHYCWPKAVHLLGIGEANLSYIDIDERGRGCARSLAARLEDCLISKTPVLGVVATVGTTELGSIDPVHEFHRVLGDFEKKHGLKIWFHADAAYGGFFRSVLTHPEVENPLGDHATRALKALELCDSITMDPHKLGYVPYSSGVFLCSRSEDYFIKSFFGPYISTKQEDVGQFTLEGSRSAAGAVATHLSISALEAVSGYARVLARSVGAKGLLIERISKLPFKTFIPEGNDTNLLCLLPLPSGLARLSVLNENTRRIFKFFEEKEDYRISKTTLNEGQYGEMIRGFTRQEGLEADVPELVLLRLTLMNPFFISKESRVDHIQGFCDELAEAVLNFGSGNRGRA